MNGRNRLRLLAAPCRLSATGLPAASPRGTILVVTMIALFSLASMTVVLCRSARVEAAASSNLAASIQASAIERGAEHYVLALLEQEQEGILDLPEDDFAAVQVGDGFFWVVRPDYGDTSLPLYGVVDESSKLNINTAGEEALSKLPDMTADIAAAIADWRDEDSNTRTGGAENDYYLSLTEPYFCKNGPFETVEELLLVRGMTRELLYGDPVVRAANAEQGAFKTRILDNQQAGRGIYDLVTRYSSEPGAAGGQGKVNVNDMGQRNRLRDLLRRQLGETRGTQVAGLVGPPNLRDVFDFHFRTGLSIDEFRLIENGIATSAQTQLRGRININTATRDVLACLPNLESADADKLISQRPASGETSLGWVIQALDRKAIGLGSLITARAYQYSADIVAASGNGRAFKRCRIVVDLAGDAPRIVYRRDLTERGWPLDQELLASLRAGNGVTPGTAETRIGGMDR